LFISESQFQLEINRDNVLGTGGQLAICFGVLLRTLWQGTKYSCAPTKLKEIVAHSASQFMGYAQHDAQEFMAFLLDGLHEVCLLLCYFPFVCLCVVLCSILMQFRYDNCNFSSQREIFILVLVLLLV
jgi:hypothetical protein